MKCENNNLSVIQGDILEVYFVLENISSEEISKVVFSCAEQDLEAECDYSASQEGYGLRLESDVTKDLKPCQSRYDLTVRFADGNDLTVVYEGVFAVLEKRDAIRGGDNGEQA